jgi:hypothetical protein
LICDKELKTYWGENKPCSTNGLGKIGLKKQNKKNGTRLLSVSPQKKINAKWIKDFNVRPEKFETTTGKNKKTSGIYRHWWLFS